MNNHSPAPGSKEDFREIVEILTRMRVETLHSGQWSNTREKLFVLRRLAHALAHKEGKPPTSIRKAVRALQEAEQLVNQGISPQEREAIIRSPPPPGKRQWFRFLRRRM